MKRRPIKNVAKDKKIFRRTATRTKRVNLGPLSFRGGTRL